MIKLNKMSRNIEFFKLVNNNFMREEFVDSITWWMFDKIPQNWIKVDRGDDSYMELERLYHRHMCEVVSKKNFLQYGVSNSKKLGAFIERIYRKASRVKDDKARKVYFEIVHGLEKILTD